MPKTGAYTVRSICAVPSQELLGENVLVSLSCVKVRKNKLFCNFILFSHQKL